MSRYVELVIKLHSQFTHLLGRGSTGLWWLNVMCTRYIVVDVAGSSVTVV